MYCCTCTWYILYLPFILGMIYLYNLCLQGYRHVGIPLSAVNDEILLIAWWTIQYCRYCAHSVYQLLLYTCKYSCIYHDVTLTLRYIHQIHSTLASFCTTQSLWLSIFSIHINDPTRNCRKRRSKTNGILKRQIETLLWWL